MTDTWWTDDDVAWLRGLKASGLSAAQIGRVMGRSRSAVLGKIHRLAGYKRGDTFDVWSYRAFAAPDELSLG